MLSLSIHHRQIKTDLHSTVRFDKINYKINFIRLFYRDEQTLQSGFLHARDFRSGFALSKIPRANTRECDDN